MKNEYLNVRILDNQFVDENGVEFFNDFRVNNPWKAYVVINRLHSPSVDYILQVGLEREYFCPVLTEGNCFYRVEPEDLPKDIFQDTCKYTFNTETRKIEEYIKPIIQPTKEELMAKLLEIQEQLAKL